MTKLWLVLVDSVLSDAAFQTTGDSSIQNVDDYVRKTNISGPEDKKKVKTVKYNKNSPHV